MEVKRFLEKKLHIDFLDNMCYFGLDKANQEEMQCYDLHRIFEQHC